MSDASKDIEHWFAAYARYLKSGYFSGEITLGEHFLCPCCYFPTLNGRGGYQGCLVCWWEDTGQDDPEADTRCRGPNHGYSLSEARINFLNHQHMFTNGKGIAVVENPSDNRKNLVIYVKRVMAGDLELNITEFQALVRRYP